MSNIASLEKEIRQARTDYYNSVAIMSDAEYDALVDELTVLDPKNPLLQEVGAEPTSQWIKEKHLHPLGSLNKANTLEDIESWYAKYSKNHSVVVVEKLDGLSIGAQYENGKLVKAILRGNGVEGEDIFANFIRMIGVKQQLKDNFTGVLRGEIVLTNTLHAKHFVEYANPRNAASGICRRLDGAGSQHLTVYFYEVIGKEFRDEVAQLEYLKSQDLEIPGYRYCETMKDVWAYYNEYIAKTRNQLNYWIDGMVLSCNNTKHRVAMGELHHRPRGKIALKFPNQLVKTKITKITWNVGNTGRITPIGWFDPINILGSTVEKASVYNFSYIQELGLGVGATVLVCKANEIIPRIERVISAGEKTSIPTECPTCHGKATMVGENLQCIEKETCPDQVLGKLLNWINTHSIMEWGDKLLTRLIQDGLIHQVPDLYELTVPELAALDRMGEKSAQKCYDNLWANNPIPLDLFLGGLSIPMIGASTIQMIMDGGLDTLEKIRNAPLSSFQKIKGMGNVKAANLVAGLKDNAYIIDKLLKAGIIVANSAQENSKTVSDKLGGMSICITGSTNMKRSDLATLITANGGKFKDSVSKDCTHLIVADPSKISTKMEKASKLGVIIMAENDLIELLHEK